jgi:hypothetical protein
VRIGISARAIAVLAVVLLTTGSVIAADPSIDSSATPASSGTASSPEASASIASSEAPSVEPSVSVAPSASAQPSPSVAPSAAPLGPALPGATEAPDASEKPETPEAPPTDAEIADFVGRLKAAGITTTAATFKTLAAKVGVGGAVRTLAFAHASGKTPAQILAMFEGGMGWGKIDHQLGLTIGPGIGWIMSGGHSH